MHAATQSCTALLLNGVNQTIFTFGTSNQGAAPCRLVVSGAGGGGFAILDANNAVQDFQGAYSLAGTQQGTLPVGSVLKQVQRELQRPGNCLATLLTEKDDRGFCRAECQTVLGGHDRLPHPPVGRQPGDLCHSLRELCRPLPDLQHSAAGTARMMPALHAVSRCSTTLPSWPSTTLRHICQLCGTLPPIIRPPSAPSAWSCSK